MRMGSLVISLLFSLPCLAQIHVHLRVKMNNNFTELSMRKMGMRAQLTTEPDIEIPVPGSRLIDTSLVLPAGGFYLIEDAGKGHQVYLSDGDNVELTLNRKASAYAALQQGQYVPVLNTLSAKAATYTGNYTFFDRYFTRIHYLVKFAGRKKETVAVFKKRCDSAYRAGQRLLQEYAAGGTVSGDFSKAAGQELNGIYLSWLCEPMSIYSKAQLPADYLNLADTMSFTDSVYALQSDNYIQAADLMVYYIYNDFTPGKEYSNLANEYNTKKIRYQGIVKDQLLAWSITDYADKNDAGYDSIYQDFLVQCRNQVIKRKAVYKAEQRREKMTPVKEKLDFATALSNSYVRDKKGSRMQLSRALSDNLATVIDCWASWCGPCRIQMPYIHDFERKYRGKINFLYLSFDKEDTKWQSFLQAHQPLPANQYLADNEFTSSFAAYFGIDAIPRYILLSAKGAKVLNGEMPLPVNEEAFEKALEEHLK